MNTLPRLTQLVDRHLTDEQIFDFLDNPARTSTTLRLHLGACAVCHAELATLQNSLSNFRAAATSLASEHAPAFAPRPLARSGSRSTFRRNIWAASFATAAAIFAVSLSLQPHAKAPASPQTPIAEGVPPSEPSVSDEALLDGIQQDLATSIPPSLEPLAVPAAAGEGNTQN